MDAAELDRISTPINEFHINCPRCKKKCVIECEDLTLTPTVCPFCGRGAEC